jgi:type VI secretion system protein ImpJ
MNNKKIVWYEGMTLDPHHFQQWDRYFTATLNSRIQSVSPFDWGLFSVKIDRDALANGMLKLVDCSGIMQDGLPFDMPNADALPAVRNFEEQFSPVQTHLPVYLAVPSERPQGLNCSLTDGDTGTATRYSIEEISLNDENSGRDERRVGVARKNFHLLIGDETTDDYAVIRIAEVTRNSEGVYVLSEEYIPPSLSVHASENLSQLIRRILELLIARANALKKSRRQLQSGQFEVNVSDIPMYMNLSAINVCIPLLHHYLTFTRVHPVEVYAILLSFTGQLATFSPDEAVDAGELPVYKHADPASGFITLERYIRQLLGDVIPAKKYTSIDLLKKGETLYLGEIPDGIELTESSLYIVCKGNLPEGKITNDLPQKIRVASKEMIQEILSTATRALTIVHTPKPPNGVPSRAGFHYYKLEKQGPFWKAIEKSQNIALYIPAEFRNLGIELIAVK